MARKSEAKLNRAEIQKRASAFLVGSKEPKRWMEILREVRRQSPQTPRATVAGAVRQMLNKDPQIIKIGRGIYLHSSHRDSLQEEPYENNKKVMVTSKGGSTRSVSEETFYEPFADWLLDQEEVNAVKPLGGNIFKSKWGTPDVIGVLKPQAADPVKFNTQIVSAEIKIDASQPIVAFGQAVAYRLFSHKTFIVLPRNTIKADVDRLEALAILHGIGLVFFDRDQPDSPGFELKVPAQISTPDMYYVNDIAKRIRDHAERVFNHLFS